MKRAGLSRELVEVREALGCATLQRDVLQTEKAEVAEALAKVSPVSHAVTRRVLPTGQTNPASGCGPSIPLAPSSGWRPTLFLPVCYCGLNVLLSPSSPPLLFFVRASMHAPVHWRLYGSQDSLGVHPCVPPYLSPVIVPCCVSYPSWISTTGNPPVCLHRAVGTQG